MIQLLTDYLPMFLEGMKNTLLASIIALALSLIIGTLMAVMQVSKIKPLNILANIYVEFFRNIPLLLIVMFFYVVVPTMGLPLSGFVSGVLGLTIYTSAFIADNVRAGIQSIGLGQHEAALSQGLTERQVMRYVILPQAIRKIIPPLGNQFINLVKNSSILAVVAGLDLMYFGDLVASETFITFSTYVLVGLAYLCITVPLTKLMQVLENYLNNLY